MNTALEEFMAHWQPRQRQSFGMIATLAVRLQNLANNHPAWSIYDLPSIALGALHLVTEPSRLSGGWTREQLVEGLIPLTRAAGPGRPSTEHWEVVEAAVDVLLNRSGGGAAIQDLYGDWTGEVYEQRKKPLSYLYVVGPDEDEEQTLKAHPRAVNMYQGLYTLDLEDQDAADAFIADRQLERGDVDEVVATVKRQHMTMQTLVDRIRGQINQMRRDIRVVDYVAEVGPAIEQLLRMLGDHLSIADDFKTRVEQRLEPGQPGFRQLMEARRMLELRCHTLAAILDEVGHVKQVFEEEQDRQVWTRYSGSLHDPETELFTPLLSMAAGGVCAILGPVCAQLLGPHRPRVVSALAVAERSAAKPRKATSAALTDPFDVGDLTSPPPWISPEHTGALRGLLGPVEVPTRLSQLLLRAVDQYPTLCTGEDQASLTRLICLLVLTSFAPPQATEIADERAAAVLARHRGLLDPDKVTVVEDGTLLALAGVSGNDLLLVPAKADFRVGEHND